MDNTQDDREEELQLTSSQLDDFVCFHLGLMSKTKVTDSHGYPVSEAFRNAFDYMWPDDHADNIQRIP